MFSKAAADEMITGSSSVPLGDAKAAILRLKKTNKIKTGIINLFFITNSFEIIDIKV